MIKLFLCLLAFTPAAVAQSTNALALRTDLPDVGASAIRAFAALAVVLGIFLAGVWLFRNGQRVAWRKNGAPRLTVLESRSLGNRQSIFLVGCDQQRLLIGSSPAGMSLLTELPPDETTPRTEAQLQNVSFAESLRQRLQGISINRRKEA